MAFSGFGKSFASAYRGFGPGGAAAAAGAALIAPALFRTDERGYSKTAAVTTPLVAAAYVASPGVVQGAKQFHSDFGNFWKNKPFSFKNGLPHLRDFPEMERLARDLKGGVRDFAANMAARKEGQYYASAERFTENTSLAANQALDSIQGLNRKRNQLAETIQALVHGKQANESARRMAWLDRLEVKHAIKQAREAKSAFELNQGLFGHKDRNRDLQKRVKGALQNVREKRNDLRRRKLTNRMPDTSGSEVRAHMPGLREEWNKLEEQRRFLSNAAYEARLAGLTPEEAMDATILPRPLTFNEIESRLAEKADSPEFVHVMSRRARQAQRVTLGRPVASSWLAERSARSLDVLSSISEMKMAEAGHYVSKAEKIQQAIQSGAIGSKSRIVFGVNNGQLMGRNPMGAMIYNADNSNSFPLSFTHPDSPMVSMGAGFRQKGLSTSLWDEAGEYAADDYILNHLGQKFDELKEANQALFQYGGMTDSGDAMSAFLQKEFGDANLPSWAINLKKGRYRPGIFGGFGPTGDQGFEDLTLEQRAKLLAERRNSGKFTWIGQEGKSAEGYLQDAAMELMSPEMVAGEGDAFYKSMTKPVYFDPLSLRQSGIATPRMDNLAAANLAGVDSLTHLPIPQAKIGMVDPQIKSLLGDIPVEAAESIQKAFLRGNQAAAFNHWRTTNSLFQLSDRGLSAEELAHRTAVDHSRWMKSNDFKNFAHKRLEEATAWWSTDAGTSYEEHVRSTLRKIMPNATDVQVERGLGIYKDVLAADPRAAVDARKFQTVGEVGFVLDEGYWSGVHGSMESNVRLDEKNIEWDGYSSHRIKAGTVIGYKDGAPVFPKGETYINGITETTFLKEGNETSGFVANLRRQLRLGGGKFQVQGGPKGMGTLGDVHDMTSLYNRTANAFGLALLPEDVNVLSMNSVLSAKSKTHYADLMENAQELALQLVETRYTKPLMERSQQFIDELQAGGYQLVTDSGRSRFAFDPRNLAGRTGRIDHAFDYATRSKKYLDDIGQIALAPGPGGQVGSGLHKDLDAFRQTVSRGTRLSFSEYLNKHLNYSPLMMSDHASVSVPEHVKVTHSMINEMKRAGSIDAIRDIYANTIWPKGDPAITWRMAEHLQGRDFTKPLGEAIPLEELSLPDGGIKIDNRTGNSPFNPNWDRIQDNFSADLGVTLKNVALGDSTSDVRFLPKVGMKGYKGPPNKHNGVWRSTELENLYNDALRAASDFKASPNDALGNIAKARASQYLNRAAQEMVGKEGVLRAEGYYANGTYGVAVARSSGPGGKNPFDVFLSNEAISRLDDATQKRIAAREEVFGMMSRDPDSAAFHVRLHSGKHYKMALDADEIGADTRISSPYQMDHDKDHVKILAYEKASKAEREAQFAINTETSQQWKNLHISEAFQGMDDPRNITDPLLQAEFQKKGWLGEKSPLVLLKESADADRLAKRTGESILNRLTFGYTGRYANATTRIQMLLANHPDMKPGDPGHTVLNKLNYFIKQVPLSASKEKMILGRDPEALLREINTSLSQGKSGAGRLRSAFYQVAEGAGLKTVYKKEFGESLGLTHELSLKDGAVVQGRKLEDLVGQEVNLAASYMASDHGLKHIETLLSNPHRSEINRISSMLVSNEATAEQALHMLDAAAAGHVANEMFGGVAQRAARTPWWVDLAKKAGPEAGSAAEDMSHALGAFNDAIKSGGKGNGALKAAGMVAAAGLGVAAVAGVLSTPISSNKHRPEEKIGVTDRVPGEPIAGVRSSVNPKRRLLPAVQGVKTMVVSRMQQSVDLEVRTKTPDQGSQHEVAKLAQKMAEGKGYSNVTVNRIGGWQQTASKMRSRNRIKDELSRY